MINFDRKPSKKTPKEEEFDRLNAEYEKRFGDSFAFFVGFSKTFDEAIAEIKECLKTGKPQEKPEYNLEYKY